MYIHANAYKFAHNYVLHMCIHCGACTQKAQHPDTYTCTSTCSNICFCGATHAYMCMLYGHPKGCLVLLELGPLGAGGDGAAERRCHPTEPLLGTRRVPGQRETGGFFPPNKSTPPSQLMETWPWSKYVSHPRGCQHQPPYLLPRAHIFFSASKLAASALGNFGCGLLEATAASRAQRRLQETPLSHHGLVR